MNKREWFKAALMATESPEERLKVDYNKIDWNLWDLACYACWSEYGCDVSTTEAVQHERAQIGQFCCEKAGL